MTHNVSELVIAQTLTDPSQNFVQHHKKGDLRCEHDETRQNVKAEIVPFENFGPGEEPVVFCQRHVDAEHGKGRNLQRADPVTEDAFQVARSGDVDKGVERHNVHELDEVREEQRQSDQD